MNERCRDCPAQIRIVGAGQMQVKSSELIKCCKVKKQIEAVKQLRLVKC